MKYGLWLNEWLEYYVRPVYKSRTYQKYRHIARMQLIPNFGEMEMTELTTPVLQKYVTSLSERYASNTVNGVLSVINCSYNRAKHLGMVSGSPASSVTHPRNWEKRVVCFDVSEQKKIERKILTSGKPKLYGILLCLYTGLRVGELIALKWEDIDLKKGQLFVTKSCHDEYHNGVYVKVIEQPKTRTSTRVIPIPKQLLPSLRKIKAKAQCDYVVSDGKNGVSVRSYQATFSLLLKKCGVRQKGFHALRHTFATRALECGMDVKTLSELLGHNNPGVTLSRYVHSMMKYKQEMMNKLGKLIQ